MPELSIEADGRSLTGEPFGGLLQVSTTLVAGSHVLEIAGFLTRQFSAELALDRCEADVSQDGGVEFTG